MYFCCHSAVVGVLLSGDGFADGPESGPGDLELAVSCWWRAAALQALSAYVMGIMGKGLAEDAAQQVGSRACKVEAEWLSRHTSACILASITGCSWRVEFAVLLPYRGQPSDSSMPASIPQVRLIAAMLSPLLEAVVSHPSLADPARAAAAALGATHHPSMPGSTSASPIPGAGHSPRPSASSSGAAAAAAGGSSAGGTASAAGGAQVLKPLGPVAAAAAALLQLRLLEVFFFLPAAQLWSSCHEQLLQLSCRQLLGVGGSRVSPGEASGDAHGIMVV